MIKKLLSFTLCLIITSCGGINVGTGIKFKKPVNAKSYGGNPGFTDDIVKLSNEKFIGFKRPIGECGAGVTFFGIVLPIIPVMVAMNSCEKSFDISTEGYEVSIIKLKYNENINTPIFIEEATNDGYRKKFKFKIDNFWKFRMVDDKAIIVSGKTKDGKEFTEELPIKWGVMLYKEWSFP